MYRRVGSVSDSRDALGRLWFQFDPLTAYSVSVTWNVTQYFGLTLNIPSPQNPVYVTNPPKSGRVEQPFANGNVLVEGAFTRAWDCVGTFRRHYDMSVFAAADLVLSAFLGSVSLVGSNQFMVGCGGFPLPYETTIASRGPSATRQVASSVIAVAAVTRGDDLRAKAWMVWDEGGFAWLGVAKDSPADLRDLWVFQQPPNFHGPGIQVRFTPLKKPLPKRYSLTACPRALPYGR